MANSFVFVYSATPRAGYYSPQATNMYDDLFLCEDWVQRLGLVPKDTQSFTLQLRATPGQGYRKVSVAAYSADHQIRVGGHKIPVVYKVFSIVKHGGGTLYFRIKDVKLGRSQALIAARRCTEIKAALTPVLNVSAFHVPDPNTIVLEGLGRRVTIQSTQDGLVVT